MQSEKNCKIQQTGNKKAQQQKKESLQQELEMCEAAERDFPLALEKGKRAVTALEDLRDNQLKLAMVQENCWRNERKKLREQELETKVSRADDVLGK